jgi:hypothetical protein
MAKQAGVVAAGLALGVGGIAVFDRDEKPSYRPHPPSISAFSFSTSVPDAPPRPPEVIPVLETEPADAMGAVAAFLQPLAEGRPELAYPLLDEPSRRRFPTVDSWARAQVDRTQPVSFDIGASQPSRDRAGAVEVDVSATHRPSLDSIRGLTPARSASRWLARQEGGAWRVSAEPVSFRPVLPAEQGAKVVVQSWVSLLATCDASAAAQLQVGPHLYGPSSLVTTPCETRGTWTAGEPVGLDRAPDPRTFLAAFGPGVGAWARLVPVQGPGSRFLAAVAPMGDGWQVMGVAVEGQ